MEPSDNLEEVEEEDDVERIWRLILKPAWRPHDSGLHLRVRDTPRSDDLVRVGITDTRQCFELISSGRVEAQRFTSTSHHKSLVLGQDEKYRDHA